MIASTLFLPLFAGCCPFLHHRCGVSSLDRGSPVQYIVLVGMRKCALEKDGFMLDSSKNCVICGNDCAEQPRMKDTQGRYYHSKCIELERERKAQKDRQATVQPDSSQETGIEIDTMGLIDEIANDELRSTESQCTCASCGLPMSARNVICINCGFDSKSGIPLEENVRIAKPKRGLISFAENASELLCSNLVVGIAVLICIIAIVLLVLTISG